MVSGAIGSHGKVLVTGASGLLGRQVMKIFKTEGWTLRGLAFSRVGPDLVKCDIFDRAKLEEQFVGFKPNIVVHCAAERRPDILEADPDCAIKMNVEATRVVAESCKAHGAWLIFLSTNYVFDGREAPYAEDAVPCPLNVYGKSKLAAERVLAEVFPEAAIVRIPLLYGPIEKLSESPVTVLLDAMRAGDYKLDDWQERYPSNVEDVAGVLEACSKVYMSQGPAGKSCCGGIFHWQSNERLTKFSMGSIIAEIAGIDATRLERQDTPSPGAAPRPQYEEMKCQRLERLLRIEDQTQKFRSDFKVNMSRFLRSFL